MTAKQKTVSKPSPDDISTVAPDFVKLTQETLFGDIWKRPELCARDRSLVTLAVLSALNRIEQIDFHLGYGLDHGLTEEEIVAAMISPCMRAGPLHSRA
jgi:4-carboxymuconolactone decarboxylase